MSQSIGYVLRGPIKHVAVRLSVVLQCSRHRHLEAAAPPIGPSTRLADAETCSATRDASRFRRRLVERTKGVIAKGVTVRLG